MCLSWCSTLIWLSNECVLSSILSAQIKKFKKVGKNMLYLGFPSSLISIIFRFKKIVQKISLKNRTKFTLYHQHSNYFCYFEYHPISLYHYIFLFPFWCNQFWHYSIILHFSSFFIYATITTLQFCHILTRYLSLFFAHKYKQKNKAEEEEEERDQR